MYQEIQDAFWYYITESFYLQAIKIQRVEKWWN